MSTISAALPKGKLCVITATSNRSNRLIPKSYHASEGQPTEHLSRKQALAAIAATIIAIPSYANAETASVADGSIEAQVAPPPQSVQQFKTFSNPTLAYSFEYPSTTIDGSPLNLLLTRQPERYSSAAPLTADARQRIVAELADLRNAITLSVSVGPPSPLLKAVSENPADWKPEAVAEQVLVDRSTYRVTSGQRVSLNSVEAVNTDTKDGIQYIVYEHVSKGSPTLRSGAKETYRHALAVTAMRPGLDGSPYLYTLNVSCPEDLWGQLEDGFRRSVKSFTLLKPDQDYVAPDQDPWRFF